MLQRLPAAEMLMHYMDLHSYDAKPPSTELAEVVMDEILRCKLNLRDAVLFFYQIVSLRSELQSETRIDCPVISSLKR